MVSLRLLLGSTVAAIMSAIAVSVAGPSAIALSEHAA
jgi:hypothetical protein